MTRGSYGTKFKEDARRYYGSFVGFAARGEMIPNEDCYADLDPTIKDKFGIPVLRFHWKWSDHELNQAAHAEKTFAALFEAMGGTVRGKVHSDRHEAIENPGSIIHEVGGAIIGADRKNPSATCGTRPGTSKTSCSATAPLSHPMPTKIPR